ncbi:MAG: tRNA pseudouridine(38-40) synthase TruA [Proteobacteria bacterium]|nr:tRNA pseudouridine(38-40) synthase TruA [Pseudomonadota bacterium]
MTRNFKLVIEYDGTRYHGWQRQNNERTIQGEIEKVIKIITREDVDLIGSGRTDTGVHAKGQVANFLSITGHLVENIQKGMNSLLPDDIVIQKMEEVPIDFHAQFKAKRKTYHYHIRNTALPCAINRQYAWFIRRGLDITDMNKAASHLIGAHDFKSFESVGSPRTHTTRTISKTEIKRRDDQYLVFEIEANGFLRHMVRNIMGTLVDVGLGKTSIERFREILFAKDRREAGQTAPPHGLFLMHVDY